MREIRGNRVSFMCVILLYRLQVLGQEPRQTTSNLGHLQKPSVQALIHGLNRHYYSISINYRKNELEQKMLLNLHKKTWMDGLTLAEYSEHSRLNENIVSEMLELAKNYNKVKHCTAGVILKLRMYHLYGIYMRMLDILNILYYNNKTEFYFRRPWRRRKR